MDDRFPAGPRIVLASAEPSLAQTLRQSLNAAGFAISGEVGTGSAAVTAAVADRPDVVVMATELLGNLPAVTAVSLITTLRDPASVVVLVRAGADRRTAERCRLAGASAVLGPSATVSSITQAVRDVCRQRQAGGEGPGRSDARLSRSGSVASHVP